MVLFVVSASLADAVIPTVPDVAFSATVFGELSLSVTGPTSKLLAAAAEPEFLRPAEARKRCVKLGA